MNNVTQYLNCIKCWKYIVGALMSLIFRVLAISAQWLLKRYFGILVKIGSVGLFSCKKVEIIVKKGLRLVRIPLCSSKWHRKFIKKTQSSLAKCLNEISQCFSHC